jgi:hypothetical protein
MDETFGEWAQNDSQQACVRRWAKQLIELGCTWDTFDRPENEITDDFVNGGGIPLVAARDIVWLAKKEMQRRKAPLSIFWDIENMSIPEWATGRDITTRLKTILAPYGNLVQFRAYARIDSTQIPQKKRSELQLSGCDLVDCPHSGRKEMADKMIIVDAMEFAYTNPDIATLCFITKDVDHAYLLSKLQKPQWRTIVISKGTMASMLHVNCNIRMRWDTDICVSLSSLETPNGNGDGRTRKIDNSSSTSLDREQNGISEEITGQPVAPMTSNDGKATKSEDTYNRQILSASSSVSASEGSLATQEGSQQFTAVTQSQMWKDDAELLLSLVKSQGGVGFKRTISTMLHSSNPARFPDRRVIGSFLTDAIEAGIIVETGQGNYKELSIPYSETSNGSELKTSKVLPRYLKDMITDKVASMAESLPFLLFCQTKCFSSGFRIPKGIYVARTYDKNWLILMFSSLSDVHRFDGETPHGLDGTVLVDWASINLDDDVFVGTCCKCGEDLLESQVIYKISANKASEDGDAYCSNCYRFDSLAERRRAVSRVIDLLTVMAVNDDIYLPRKQVKKLLYERYRGVCTSHQHAEFWIDEAVSQDKVAPFKREGQKKMFLCLSFSLTVANGEHPPDDLDTSKEEKHVKELLDAQKDSTWLPRKTVIESLSKNFPATMKSPLYRSKVFQNGHKKKSFFVARGPFGQTVGITEQAAQDALETMTKEVREEVTLGLNDNGLSSEKMIPEVTATLQAEGSLDIKPATSSDPQHRIKIDDSTEVNGQNKANHAQTDLKSASKEEIWPKSTRVDKESLERAGKRTLLYGGGGNDLKPDSADLDDWEAESINSAEIDARLNLQLSFLDDE